MTRSPGPVAADVFGTAAQRDLVLAAWRASPARLREDANAEEDAALGAYRDRLVVELAQNAADAAAAAGRDGRLLLRLVEDPDGGPGVLLAANTGSPLDAAGVLGLATLRASAKRGGDAAGTVGRFGVGFSAVLAVTDEPSVSSTTGAVRFSRSGTAELVEQVPELAEELSRRSGHVPALRLPFPAPDAAAPPAGYDTVVVLPLRDAAARALVEELLTAVDDVLLLALPQLREVVLERPGRPPRTLSHVEERWEVLRRSGFHDPEALAGRGTEERGRLRYEVTWALPRSPDVHGPGVLAAPTPTDEDLPWRAVLVATFPMGPDRRRTAPGPATTTVLDAAAAAYGELLVQVAADGRDALALLPHGAAAGPVDAELRRRVLDGARDLPVLPAVETTGVPGERLLLRASSAIALTGVGADDPALLAALAPSLAGLVAAPRALDRLLTDLGVTRVGLADALDLLPGTSTPDTTRDLFAALASLAADPVAREAMSGLAVPLLDGRVVHGPRGVLALDGDSGLDADGARLLAGHGLRLVDPAVLDAVGRDLLVRLGARAGGARVLLTEPAVAAAVADSPDADDPDAVAEAVLGIVEAVVGDDLDLAARTARELPFLADLALPDGDDELAPAMALVVPGSLAARALDPDDVAEVHPELLQQWGTAVLQAVGVLTGPAVVEFDELDLEDPDTADDAGLAGFSQYAREVWGDVLGAAEDTLLTGVVAVRDLDLVVAAWPDFLGALTATPEGLGALTAPWRVGAHRRQGLTAWWLRRSGPVPAPSRDPSPAAPAWLPPAPAWVLDLPAAARAALGVLGDLADAGADDVLALLTACAAADEVPAAAALTVHALLARHAADLPVPTDPPSHLRVVAAGSTRVVASADVVVPDSPAWAQRTDLGAQLLVPAGAAEAVVDLLDVDLASDRADGATDDPRGTVHTVPAELRAWWPTAPAVWTQVADLRVDGVPVEFWVTPQDEVLARGTGGAAAGLAQVCGVWSARVVAAAVLRADAVDRAGLVGAELPGAHVSTAHLPAAQVPPAGRGVRLPSDG